MAVSSGLRLTRGSEQGDAIDALAALLADHGAGRVGIERVLADLPQRVRRTLAPHPRLLGRTVTQALTWEAADRRDPHWYPQGISHSGRTGVPGRVLVTSWYAKHGQGSRVTFVDLDRRRYRHVLLVQPVVVDGRPTIKPLEVHAGGLVWHHRHLHVAATRRGFLTCHLDDVLQVPDPAPVEAYGYRYLLPVRLAHRADSDEGVERLRYSFLSLDRSDATPHLVVGEYGSARQTRRLTRVPVDDSGAIVTDEDGVARPVLDDGGPLRMQGAAVADGTYYVTASQGHWTPGTIHVGRPGAFREHRWATPTGPEDLVWWPETDRLWSTTEHPHRRWIVAMKRPSS